MPRLCLIFLLCLCLGVVACGRDETPPELLIFILAGQSNMSGRGELNQLPDNFPANRERIANFNNAYQWSGPQEPLDSPQGQKDLCSLDLTPGVGPGASFGQRISELMPTVHVGLIPCALGGAGIAMWAPSTNPKTLYGSSIRRAGEAAKRGRVRGVLFFQGESDTASRAAVVAWPRRFAALVAAWRRDLGDPTLPVVFAQLGRLGGNLKSDPDYRYWNLLKAKQAKLRLPYVAMVRSDDLALKPDGIHLSTSGQIFLGRRMAEAMYRLLIHRDPRPDPVADRWVGGSPL
ncbi:MAG: sialate O-acetylesterase [Desulfarculaceae bacterium]|nr:sialate O-acetylesterase [Desulfarculaceae bacterium]